MLQSSELTLLGYGFTGSVAWLFECITVSLDLASRMRSGVHCLCFLPFQVEKLETAFTKPGPALAGLRPPHVAWTLRQSRPPPARRKRASGRMLENKRRFDKGFCVRALCRAPESRSLVFHDNIYRMVGERDAEFTR